MSIYYQNSPERLRLYTSENNSFSTHLHRQVELLVVLEGELTLTVDSTTYKLVAGMCAIVFPNQLHGLYTHHASRILLCIFETDFCHSYHNYFQNNIPSDNVLSLQESAAHSSIAVKGLLGLTECFPRGELIPPHILALAEGYLTLLLAELFSHMNLRSRTISEDLELEQQLLIYIEAHYTEPLSLDHLSREFGVSRFTLSRLFTDKLHTSFPGYVNSKRLDYACNLLLSTNLSVTQIALDAGFGSSRTFFREFNQIYHTTPREYRKQHGYP